MFSLGAVLAAVTTHIGELSSARLRGRYTSRATTAAYAGFSVVPLIARGRRYPPPSPRWLVSRSRPSLAREVVADAEETALEAIDGDRLPEPGPVPGEAPAERVPVNALLRRPMAGRVSPFVAIWFVPLRSRASGS